MTPTTKKVLIIAAIVVGAGLLLALLAWAFGAATSLVLGRGGVVAVTHVRHEVDAALSEFDEIDLRLSVSTLTIRQGDSFHIEGSYYGREFNHEITNGVLIVRGEEGTWTPGTQIGVRHPRSGSLTITMPEGTDLGDITLMVGVGNISLRELAADAVDISAGVGEISFRGTFSDSISISAGVGEIDVNATGTGSVSMEAGVGDVSFRGTFAGTNTIEVGTGDITVEIFDSQDNYSYNLQTGIGQIQVAGARSRGPGGQMSQTVPDPTGSLRMQLGVGSISLDFRD